MPMNKKRPRQFILKISDALFWIALAVILIWALLKSFGAIQSPTWQEMIPVFSAVFIAGRIYAEIKHHGALLDRIQTRQYRMANGMTCLERDFRHLKGDFERHIAS